MEQPKTAADLLSALSSADLTSAYRTIKAQVAAIEAEIKPKLDKRKERLEQIETEMRRRMNAEGTDSTTITGVGNWHFRTNSFVSVADWPTFYKHLQERLASGARFDDVMGAFQKKIKKEFVQSFQEKHDGHVPPGVNIVTEREIYFKTV
jgi:SpoVK/Ycf46/Vps4 family AAA+-type ATPase